MHTKAEQEDRLNTEGSDRLAQTVVINCGRALAQAVDEQDLLQSVCNTLVNDCGFRLAWVGLTEPGTSNSIRLVAQAGDQDGFLQEPRCSETPATLAIQAGESCCIKAIADSPLVVPIRAAALKRGYTSVLSLPLKSDGKLFGALTIYADDPGKLDERIIERLRQWSDLFALRVKTLRSLQERDLKNDFDNIGARQRLENQLRLIIDTTPALIHTSRPDGYLDYFNKRWVEYLGVSLDDVEGWKWTASVHPDDVAGIVDKWRTCLASEEIFGYETRVRRADGEYRRMLHRKVPVRDEHGKILKWYGSSMDIEDYKGAEEQLRRSAEELQRSESYLAEGQRLAHIGSWAFDAAGFDYWSPELFRMHGLEPASKAPTVQEYLDCVHPQDREFMAELIKRILAKPSRFDATKRIVRPDGEVRYIRCVGTPVVENQRLKKYVGSAIDVTEQELLTQELHSREAYLTERKRAEEAVLRSEKELRNVIETIPISVWTALPDGTVDFVSRHWREHSGLSEENASGAGWQTAVHPDDVDRHMDKWRMSLATGAPFENEARRRAADGEYRWFLARAVPLRDEQGNILKWYGITMEIEDRKRAEALLAGEKHVLEMVAKGDSLTQILESLCLLVEEQAQGALASVLLVQNGRLMHGGSPSLPKAYTAAVDGIAIGPTVGSCGTAAYRGEQVIVSDIATDPLWANYREIPLSHSLRACWSTPIFSPEGSVIGTFGIYYREPRSPSQREQEMIEQISHLAGVAVQRKFREDELRESEAKLEEAQRLAHVGYWERDTDTDLITWSDETYRIFGLQPQARILNLAQLPELVHPEDKQIVIKAVAEALRGGPRYDVEYRVLRPNGEVRLVHSQGDVMWNESGRPRRMFGTVQDITERKQAEQRLVAQHNVTQILAQAATLQEATPKILQAVCECLVWDVGVLWRVDREAGVLRCVEIWHDESVEVPQFEAICRQHTFMPGVGLPGRVWSSHEPAYIPDVVHDTNFPRASIAAREGLHAAFGFPILLGADVLGVIECFSHEIRQPDQELLDMMATLGSQIGQFIERKRAEEAFRTAQIELAHVTRVATLGEMTASIAHEINQPLGALVNNAGACLGWLDAENLEEARNSVALMLDDAQRVTEVITRVRSLVKKAPPQKDWLDINQMIREIIGLARNEMQRNGVALETQLSDDMPLDFADRIQLQQVMLNLMMNAIEAMTQVAGPREVLIY